MKATAAGILAAVLLAAGCGGSAGTATREAVVETIAPAAAADLLGAPPAGLVVLDVRTPEEFASGHLEGAVNLDFRAATFAEDLAVLDRDVPYLLYCRSGNRSASARDMMASLEFSEIHEIAGGIDAWLAAGLPVEMP